jgi:lipoate-protein ligase A
MRRLLISPFHDPYLNLALEGRFLEELPRDEEILFLYTNTPSVVIGRFQNPWKESRPSRLGETALVRRESGGGTVYHDRGNLNFSFIQNNDDYDRQGNLETICSILAPWGLPLRINERHDLAVEHEGKAYKISGSAFRHKKDRAFHHGTLLVNCETDKLRASIVPGEEKNFLKSSGTASKRSPVINLQILRDDMTTERAIDTFRSYYRELSDGSARNLNEEEWSALARETAPRAEELRSDAWRFGKTPAFTQDISSLRLPESEGWSLRVEKGVIKDVPPPLEGLKGLPYGRDISGNLLRERLPVALTSGAAGDEFLRRLVLLIS